VTAFFIDVFSIDTWEQAKGRGWTLSGYPPPTHTKGGYFQSTFDKVKPGDVLCCYVRAPAKRWVGAVRVVGPMFLDYNDDLWGRDEWGKALFPARFKVEPEIALDVAEGLPVEETIGVLKCLEGKHWSGLFRRSLNQIPREDGETLLRLLSEPRAPSPVHVPQRRAPKAAAKAAVEAATAPAEPTPVTTPRTVHPELVAKLIRLGKAMGCEVWVAPGEKGQSFEGYVFKDETLKEFPAVGLDPESGSLVRHIDVIWVTGNKIEAAFEVEVSTSIYSGLLRMSDLITLQPNTSFDLYIVAPDARESEVRTQMLRPTFESYKPPMRRRCKFIPATRLGEALRAVEPLKGHVEPKGLHNFALEFTPPE
jgi:hypothetical protein